MVIGCGLGFIMRRMDYRLVINKMNKIEEI